MPSRPARLPADHIANQIEAVSEPVENMINRALKGRPELQEQSLGLENSSLSRKTARYALLPQLSVYGLYAGTGLAGNGRCGCAPSNTLARRRFQAIPAFKAKTLRNG